MFADSHNETVHFVVNLHQRRAFRRAHRRGRVRRTAKARFERLCLMRRLLLLLANRRLQGALKQMAD
jgi:hypothetical protein